MVTERYNLAAVRELQPDDRFNNYVLQERLDKGGFAEVWLARHADLSNKPLVAIKFMLNQSDPRLIERFRREAGDLGHLKGRNPHIIEIEDSGEEKGRHYMILQYAPHGTLARKIKRDLPLETVVNYLEQISDGLDFVHQNGIIHRDLKPENILLDATDALLLADFGIARNDDDEFNRLTHTNEGFGTPKYMAPEQFTNAGNVTVFADIYSLGVIAFELFTGVLPFRQNTFRELQMAHYHAAVPQLSNYNQNVPPTLQKVIEKALDKSAKNRFLTAGRFVADIKEAIYTWQAEKTIMQTQQQLDNTQKDLQSSKQTLNTQKAENKKLMEQVGIIYGLYQQGLNDKDKLQRQLAIEKNQLRETRIRLTLTITFFGILATLCLLVVSDVFLVRLWIIVVLIIGLFAGWNKITRDKIKTGAIIAYNYIKDLIYELWGRYKNRNQ